MSRIIPNIDLNNLRRVAEKGHKVLWCGPVAVVTFESMSRMGASYSVVKAPGRRPVSLDGEREALKLGDAINRFLEELAHGKA